MNIFRKKIKNTFRPYKRSLLRFLVFAKKHAIQLRFRITRFIKVFIFLSNPQHREEFRPAFQHREKFNNYLRLGFTRTQFVFLSLFTSQQMDVGIIGEQNEKTVAWAENIHKLFGSKIYWVEKDLSPLKKLRLKYLGTRNSSDLLFIDAQYQLPSSVEVLQLLIARKHLRPEEAVSGVHPSYVNSGHTGHAYQGYVFNVSNQQWLKNSSETDEFRQSKVPTWSLQPHWHCLLLSGLALKQLNVSLEDHLPIETEIENISRALWAHNRPILCYPNFEIGIIDDSFIPRSAPINPNWSLQKSKNQKVIFVLPATTLSGGIRVVFEVAEGLSARGIETEIWSLRSPISWDLLNVPLRQFDTYSALIHALSNEDAIKVATWWETSDIVFLSSVIRGLPVQFVQEFETWFYPDDLPGQAAVAASYRPEFKYITTASYQLNELKSINIEPTLIPVGYESSIYFQLDNLSREENVVLALGRSFFQKNFQMTSRAWKRLEATETKLWLFGHEPDVLKGSNVTYFDRPSNTEVNKLLNQATIFVQTSIHEGFSLPILEAMAAGCPVITTDSHGNRDFCFDGVNCIIVEQDNDEQLALSIQKLLKDKPLRDELSRQGLITANKFQWAGILDRYSTFFRELS